MLDIDGEYLTGYLKSVKHSIEKPNLLKFVNF